MKSLKVVSVVSTVLLVGCFAAAGFCQSASASIKEPGCEIHVSGAGWPNRVPTLGFFMETKRRENEEPLSPLNRFGTVYRSNTLDKKIISGLLPDSDIVFHDKVVDLDDDSKSSSKDPLYNSNKRCYADLILLKIDGLFPDPDRNPYGAAGALIAGNDRLVSTFSLKIFNEKKMIKSFKKKFNSPIPAFYISTDTSLKEGELKISEASNSNLQKFSDFINKK